jgi:hypothetical protein
MDEDFETYVAEHNARIAAWERFENKRTDWQVYDHLINEELYLGLAEAELVSREPSTNIADKRRRREWHG